MNPIKTEPALVVSTIMAFITIAIAFGAPISPEQKAALQENLPAIIGGIFLMGGTIRQLVFAPATVDKLLGGK